MEIFTGEKQFIRMSSPPEKEGGFKARVKEKIRDLGESTTSHAIPNIVRSNSKLIRIMWLLFFMGALTYSLYTIVNSIMLYLQYNANIQIDIKRVTITDFPAVTICNANLFNSKQETAAYIDAVLITNNLSEAINITAVKRKSVLSTAQPASVTELSTIQITNATTTTTTTTTITTTSTTTSTTTTTTTASTTTATSTTTTTTNKTTSTSTKTTTTTVSTTTAMSTTTTTTSNVRTTPITTITTEISTVFNTTTIQFTNSTTSLFIVNTTTTTTTLFYTSTTSNSLTNATIVTVDTEPATNFVTTNNTDTESTTTSIISTSTATTTTTIICIEDLAEESTIAIEDNSTTTTTIAATDTFRIENNNYNDNQSNDIYKTFIEQPVSDDPSIVRVAKETDTTKEIKLKRRTRRSTSNNSLETLQEYFQTNNTLSVLDEILDLLRRSVISDTNLTTIGLKNLGVSLDNILLSCSFNKKDCDSSQFSSFWSYRYGNCYTFNSKSSQPVTLQTSQSGSSYGLRLELFLGKSSKR